MGVSMALLQIPQLSQDASRAHGPVLAAQPGDPSKASPDGYTLCIDLFQA